METYKQAATEKLPSGEVTVKMLSESDEPKPGSGGKVTLWANGKQIREGTMPKTVPVTFSSYSGMDIGRDNGWSSTSTTSPRPRTRSPAP